MYAAQNYRGVNERLNAMFDEIMELRGYTKISNGHYVEKTEKEIRNRVSTKK